MPRRLLKLLAFFLGLTLVAAAVVVAARGIAPGQLAHANPWLLASLAGLVVVNLVLTAALLWLMTLSFDAVPPVRLGTMLALLSASGLLNYLPLQPGMISRTAYLKLRHALPIRQSVIVMVLVRVVGALVMATALLLVVLRTTAGRWAALALALGLLTVVTGPLSRWVLRRELVAAWAWVPLRALDMLAAAARLWLAFIVIGHPLPFHQALIAGAASMFVSQLGLTPNGLGLSEWVVAGISEALAPTTAASGAAAKLIDRGAEALVFIIAGLWSLRSLRLRANRS
jgi:hypothetical protein